MPGTVVMVPSLGRPASDFDGLAATLADAGFTTLLVDPPGLGTGERTAVRTLHDLAAHVATAISRSGVDPGPVHLVGHALGNRIARCLTADRPELVASLTLLAAGGLIDPSPEAWAALAGCFDLTTDPSQHEADVAFAFFADPAGAARWRDGWYPDIAAAQRDAVLATDRAHWWHAAAPRVLVVQGLQDRIAVPENGRRYVAELTARGVDARLVEIDGAGHALLPEQPTAIATAILTFLAGTPLGA